MNVEWKDPINTDQAAKEEARQRIEARRVAREKRHRRRNIEVTVLAASALCLGILIGARSTTESREQTEPPAPSMPATEIVVTATPTPTIVQPVATAPMPDAEPIEYTPPEDTEPPEWVMVDGRAMTDATPTLLPSVPLDKATQWSIYELCGDDNELFCAAMAIAYHESRFIPTVIGDNGQSISMMQVNAQWHGERMERLGTTDLTDPIQNAAVAIDYLKELTSDFGWVDGEKVYIAYNAGCSQASEWIARGVTSTKYSREVLALQQSYLAEMEGQG